MSEFTGERRGLHPALSTTYSLSSDTFPGLFDWVFANDAFKYWSSGLSTRQLHYIGGPGSGKTTLAMLASIKLKQELDRSDRPVATVFIGNDIEDESVSRPGFLADFLETVLYQFGGSDIPSANHSEPEDSGVAARIGVLRDTLRSRLSKCHRAFVVLDGIDRCGVALGSMLRNELLEYREQRLSVMITSRLPVFIDGTALDPDLALCDHEQNHDYPEQLHVYLECQTLGCGFIMCLPCREKGEICPKCGNTLSLSEPMGEHNRHINFTIGNAPDKSIHQYILWDLEREHGDLGLGSSNLNKPPLSDLGLKLRDYPTARLVELLTKSNIDGNIAMATARLDSVHRTLSVADFHASHDRIPSNIVALFDAELAKIEAQPKHIRDLTLKCIALLCHTPDCVLVYEFEKQLKRLTSFLGTGPPPSLEAVMGACRGLFAIIFYNPDYMIMPYHPLFYLYVHDNYNESLYWAKVEMRRFGPPPRSTTLDIRVKNPTFRLKRQETEIFSKSKKSSIHWSVR